jgi:multiple sugar transport system ATP-binding protein
MRLFFRTVSKTFDSLRGPVHAVREVSLSVEDGELFVLLGPSGCGKSTILNLAAGLEKPTAGEIRIGERRVASPENGVFESPKDRNVAMVFQSYALYPHLDVFGNIAFPLRVAGEKKGEIERAVRQAAGMLGIGELLRARPAELSGGQRQRVAIARAIVRKPTLFLLDEPLSNLDAALRAETRTEIRRLQREFGVTTLYVTHDQTEAMTLGDRVALLREGRISQEGTPDELYSRPRSTFAASFIGSPPMNLVKAAAFEEKGTLFLRLGRHRIAVPQECSDRVRKLGAKEFVFGIRPEHVRPERTPEGDPEAGRVTAVENLGRELLLRVAIDDAVLSLLTDDRSFREGDPVAPVIDMGAAHFFREGE